jgi:hypothetical protein
MKDINTPEQFLKAREANDYLLELNLITTVEHEKIEKDINTLESNEGFFITKPFKSVPSAGPHLTRFMRCLASKVNINDMQKNENPKT